MTLVNRDPFAREELHRERVYHPTTSCAWCGNVNTTRGPHHRVYLYAYRVETDGGRTHKIAGLFCNKSCKDAYYPR